MRMKSKNTLVLVAALSACAAAFAVDAGAAKALATKHACLACHSADKKIVGPSYKDVAAKRKGEADALAKVAARIKSGGSGIYGTLAMPPQPSLKDDELKTLAEWVLAGAPDK